MIRTVIDIVLAALISVALTLAVVTWSKTSTLERQITEVQRGVKENSKKIEEAGPLPGIACMERAHRHTRPGVGRQFPAW